MKDKLIKMTVAIMALFMISGCSFTKIFSPYETEAMCPNANNGTCENVTTAYENSIALSNYGDEGLNIESESKKTYTERKFQLMADLIEDEVAPVVIPPEVVRLLILSYTGDETEMYGHRYTYFFGTAPEFMLPTAIDEGY